MTTRLIECSSAASYRNAATRSLLRATAPAPWPRCRTKTVPLFAILDWRMPETDGIEVCRRVRAKLGRTLRLSPPPYALDTPADLVAGLDAGADDFLTKPVNMAELRCAFGPVAASWNSKRVLASFSKALPSPTMRPTRAASSFG